ncbi:hypothetical protein D9757_007460 [Collybiopsis confluens]|uniref:Uncharacterized protein n=1 Tax=Collybiopsis confluens TaxID=2823264 RepID=A0A8H5HJV7_9AGAR|nr:hypothetical protein D9757_007460 [Collybiopsis confluens]
MAFRAYQRHDDDSSTDVTPQHLSELGLDVITLHHTEDPQQEARKVLQGWGYPLEREDCVVPFDFRHDANNSEEVSAFIGQMVDLAHAPELAVPSELAALTEDSSIFFELEDIKAHKWIRIHAGPGQLYRIHPGVKVRVIMADDNRHHHGTLFVKDGVSKLGVIPGTDLHEHEVRQAFLTKIGT